MYGRVTEGGRNRIKGERELETYERWGGNGRERDGGEK